MLSRGTPPRCEIITTGGRLKQCFRSDGSCELIRRVTGAVPVPVPAPVPVPVPVGRKIPK